MYKIIVAVRRLGKSKAYWRNFQCVERLNLVVAGMNATTATRSRSYTILAVIDTVRLAVVRSDTTGASAPRNY
jgi:hypothetical protein